MRDLTAAAASGGSHRAPTDVRIKFGGGFYAGISQLHVHIAHGGGALWRSILRLRATSIVVDVVGMLAGSSAVPHSDIS